MSHKGAFDNPFDEYTLDVARNVMDDKLSSISDVFKSKLKNYESNKFRKLTTDLQHDVFHDSSVYTGSSGVALLYYLHATDNGNVIDKDLLLEGLKFIPFSDVKRKRVSFLCGDGGPLALATVFSFLLGESRPKDLPHYKELAELLIQLKDIAEKKETPDELLYGRAGYLYALLFVNKHVGRELIPASVITKIIEVIFQSGSTFAQTVNSTSPLLWQWHDKIYLGAAHGIAGILYMLLQARAYLTQDELENLVKPTLDYLLSLRYASGNLPSSKNSSGGDRLVQWCHGAPGLVQLCCLAHEVYHDKKYLNAAVECGEVTWQRGLTSKGYSICHGVAGNAYTFIQLYQATNDPVHLYRACCFAEWCAVERPGTELHKPDRPASMFEGLAGRLYLIADLRNASDAKFPAYTL